MTDSPRRRNAALAVPYSLRVAASVSWRVLLVVVLVSLIGYLMFRLRVVTIPVAVALLLTALLGPVVNWMSRYRVPRGLATALVMVGGLALICGLLAFVIQAFVSGLPGLATQVGDSIQEIRRWLADPPFGLPPVDVENLINSVGDSLSNSTGAITSGALSTAFTVGEILTGFALTLFTLIYFLYSGRSLWLFLVRLLPTDVRDRVDRAGLHGFASLVGFVRATVLVAVVDAIGIGIGLLAVGAPLVVPLTALVFLSAFVPVVGAVVSGVVAVLVVLVANGLVSALIVLAVVIGVQQLEGNVLQPLLLGRAVRINGLAVVLAVAVGSVTVGIIGALLAVPLLAALTAGIRSLVNPDADEEEVLDGDGKGPTAGDGKGPTAGDGKEPADGGKDEADASAGAETPAESDTPADVDGPADAETLTGPRGDPETPAAVGSASEDEDGAVAAGGPPDRNRDGEIGADPRTPDSAATDGSPGVSPRRRARRRTGQRRFAPKHPKSPEPKNPSPKNPTPKNPAPGEGDGG